MEQRVHFAVGRFDEKIGGPYRTLAAYADRFAQAGWQVDLSAMQGRSTLTGSSDEISGVRKFVKISGGPFFFVDMFRLVRTSMQQPTVVFGVWHPVFMSLAFVHAFLPKRTLILVPTQSLSLWDWHKHRFLKKLLAPLVVGLVKRLDKVIFSSLGERDASYPKLDEARVAVLYHPIIDPPAARLRSASRNSKRIVFLARVAVQKDPFLFVRVLAALPISWSADVVGGGDEDVLTELRGYAASLGVDDRLRWHGWKERSAAHEILGGASALVVTSYAENYCHAAVEGMALEVPVVIVDRVAVSRDFGDLGLAAIAQADGAAIAARLLELESDERARNDQVSAASRFAAERASSADACRLISLVRNDS